MKHISKKTWFAISVAVVGVSALFALKKPAKNEKSSHIVVDRLVNQLVCKLNLRSGGGKNYPRGFMDSSDHKIMAGRVGWQRNDKPRRPVGGDF